MCVAEFALYRGFIVNDFLLADVRSVTFNKVPFFLYTFSKYDEVYSTKYSNKSAILAYVLSD